MVLLFYHIAGIYLLALLLAGYGVCHSLYGIIIIYNEDPESEKVKNRNMGKSRAMFNKIVILLFSSSCISTLVNLLYKMINS